jgi:hypothetical protein
MYDFDPRTSYANPFLQNGSLNGNGNTHSNGFAVPNHASNQNLYGQGITNFTTPSHFSNLGHALHAAPAFGMLPHGNHSVEMSHLLCRIEEVRAQLMGLTELVRMELMKRSSHGEFYGQHMGGSFMNQMNPMKIRENDSHIFWDIFLPNLTMGEVDVEVSGNRIICRTRVPVSPTSRWWATSQIPRGFELFELADGRVEFNWIAPISIEAKQVEATWREGFLCVCIPKTEVAPRQTVKIVKETMNRKSVGDMNS